MVVLYTIWTHMSTWNSKPVANTTLTHLQTIVCSTMHMRLTDSCLSISILFELFVYHNSANNTSAARDCALMKYDNNILHYIYVNANRNRYMWCWRPQSRHHISARRAEFRLWFTIPPPSPTQHHNFDILTITRQSIEKSISYECNDNSKNYKITLIAQSVHIFLQAKWEKIDFKLKHMNLTNS